MTSDIPADEITGPWWEATRSRRFVIQRCRACRHWQHYPRALCLRCGGTDLAFDDASGRGVLDTWTEVRRTIRPELPAPYIVARVQLTEGPVLLTHLIGAGIANAVIGREVSIDWKPLPDGRNLPVFRLAERTA